MTLPVRLRTARPSDAAILAAISFEVWMHTYIRRGVDTAYAEYALDTFTATNLAAVLADPGEHVILSENEEGPDAFIRLTRNRPAPLPGCSDLEISTLYVQPRHHGRGLGRALLARGLDHARSLGQPSVWLATNSENAPAIAFYLRQGFERIGTTHFHIGDAAYPNDVFLLTLDR